MEDNRTFKEKSFQSNIDVALDKLTNLEFYRLSNYINSTFINEEPDSVQISFLDEIFGIENWNDYLSFYKNPKFFKNNGTLACTSIMTQVKEYLFFRLNHRFLDVLTKNSENEMEISKLKIKNIDTEIKMADSKIKNISTEITQFKNELNLSVLKEDLKNAFVNSHDDGIFDKVDGWINTFEVLKKYNLIKIDDSN